MRKTLSTERNIQQVDDDDDDGCGNATRRTSDERAERDE
jgi:hypothetical protein